MKSALSRYSNYLIILSLVIHLGLFLSYKYGGDKGSLDSLDEMGEPRSLVGAEEMSSRGKEVRLQPAPSDRSQSGFADPYEVAILIDDSNISTAEIWALIKNSKFSDVSARMILFESLIDDRVSEDNYSDFVDLAVAGFGPGAIRDELVGNIAAALLVTGGVEQFDVYEKLIKDDLLQLNGEAISRIISRVFRGMKRSEVQQFFTEHPERLSALLRNSRSTFDLVYSFMPRPDESQNPETYQRSLSEVRNFFSDSTLDQHTKDRVLFSVAYQASNRYPFLAWEVIEKEGLLTQENKDKKYLRLVAENMLKENPAKAMSSLKGLEKEFGGVKSEVFSRWLKNDSTAAVGWFETIRQSTEDVDPYRASFAKVAADKGEFDTGWKWAEEISDLQLQEKAKGEIWHREREVVMARVAEDPAVFLDSLGANESRHQAFWIKEAFGNWSESDPSAAAAWFEVNGSSLPAAKKQHVARVYANRAIESGDLDLARQWQAQVVDPKFINEIRDGIEKAEQASNEQ